MSTHKVEGLTRDDIIKAAATFRWTRKLPKWTVIIENKELPARPLVLEAAGVEPNDPTNSHMAVARLKALGFETRYLGEKGAPVEAERFDIEFLKMGLEYYAAGRWSGRLSHMPVCGNLFHHAIEMLLKARLSYAYSPDELSQRPFGHNLLTLWAEFKSVMRVDDLVEFDTTIVTLDRFESLRYPEGILYRGAAIRLSWTPMNDVLGKTVMAPEHAVPEYDLVVSRIDRLVRRIFEVCSRNPAFFASVLQGRATEAISYENAEAAFWFPSASLEPALAPR